MAHSATPPDELVFGVVTLATTSTVALGARIVSGFTAVTAPDGSRSPRYPVMLGTPLQLSFAVIRFVSVQFCEKEPLESTCGTVSASEFELPRINPRREMKNAFAKLGR